MIQVGANEILLDDSTRFKERAKSMGADVTLVIWPGMWHDWHTSVPTLLEANQAIEQIGNYVKELIWLRRTQRAPASWKVVANMSLFPALGTPKGPAVPADGVRVLVVRGPWVGIRDEW